MWSVITCAAVLKGQARVASLLRCSAALTMACLAPVTASAVSSRHDLTRAPASFHHRKYDASLLSGCPFPLAALPDAVFLPRSPPASNFFILHQLLRQHYLCTDSGGKQYKYTPGLNYNVGALLP